MSSKLLKLGGSVITDKSSRETLDKDSLDRCIDAIAPSASELVLVHGAGSYGHPHVKEHGLEDGGVNGVREVQGVLEELTRELTSQLEARGVPTSAVHPSSCAGYDDLGPLAEQVKRVLETGAVPVLHGDMLPAGDEFRVVSGDRFLAELPNYIEFEAVGACSTTGGVLDREGNLVKKVSGSLKHERDLEVEDVSGGMAGKVERMSGLEPDACIFGPGEIEEFLEGELPGTRVL